MPNQLLSQNQSMPTNTSYGADTRNLGYSGGLSNPWGDSAIAARARPQSSSLNIGSMGGGSNQLGGVMSGGLNGLIGQQIAGWNAADQANIGRFNDASSYLKQFATPFTPDVVNHMRTQNAMLAQGGQNNAFREQQGLLAGEGNGDASSMAAAASQAHRNALGAQVGANTNLGIQAALGNNAAGQSVGKSILGALPQQRANDYSGLMALSMQQQNQNTQNQILQNQMDRPMSPGMSNGRSSVGGGGGQNPWSMGSTPPPVNQGSAFGNWNLGSGNGVFDEAGQQRRLMGQ